MKKQQLTATDYGATKVISCFVTGSWRLYLAGHWGHPIVRPHIPPAIQQGALLSFTAWNPKCVTLPYEVNSAQNAALSRDLTQEGFTRVYNSFSCCAMGHWYEEGFTVHLPLDSISEALRVMVLAARYQQFSVFRYSWDAATGSFLQTQVPVDPESAELIPPPIHVVPVAYQETHPPFVCPSMEAACAVLLEHAARTNTSMCQVRKEIDELMYSATNGSMNNDYPIVTIEGPDEAACFALGAALAQRLQGVVMPTTPTRMQHHTDYDSFDERTWAAYYTLCKYSGARDIQKASHTSTVVVQRYWLNTVAYTKEGPKPPLDLPINRLVVLWLSQSLGTENVVISDVGLTLQEYRELSHPRGYMNDDLAPDALLDQAVSEFMRLRYQS